MAGDASSEPGLFATLKRLADGVLGALQNRLELLSVELHEEKWRLVELLLWAGALIFLCILAVLTITITIVVLVGDAARPFVLVGFCVLYSLGAWGALRGLRNRLQNRPRPFAATLDELKKDREWLTSRK